jgi:peptidyl-prolyl cis-trans isomerase SurA
MFKRIVLALTILFSIQIHAQVLFTYGKNAVSKKEFLAAFDKNPNVEMSRRKALDEYKDLFINFKLKVQSAYDEKLHETNIFKSESETFKKQITESFINEEANIKTLLNEAFDRSQKDINLSQIFIPNGTDTVATRMEVFKAYQELLSGKKFKEVLNKYCTDKSLIETEGNIGYITVFSLPYEIENVVYGLKKDQFSFPYKSAYGWHIFKNINDRPAVGKRKVAQILLSYPPNYSEQEKDAINKKAKDVYDRVLKGEDFGKLAEAYSNDYSTSNNNGYMGEVGLGKYNKDFEEQIFSLQKTGECSPMFFTKFGVHILKLIEKIPVGKSINDDKFMEELRTQLDKSDRLAIAKKNLVSKWKNLIGYRKAFYNSKEVWAFIDSSLKGSQNKNLLSLINDSTLLFSFKTENVRLYQFIDYIKNVRYSGTAERTSNEYEILLKMFEEMKSSEYYKNHLEEFNGNFKQQMKEFNDANLLFAAMDKHVWNKAAIDTTELQNYYEKNKSKYLWQPGVAAINVTTNSLNDAQVLAKKITANPENWRDVVYHSDINAMADSARYEYTQLPNYQTTNQYFVQQCTEPIKNKNEEQYSFVYVTKNFDKIEPRTFTECKGMVINDYQQVLEKNWIDSLKKKYPVKWNEVVWKTIK